MSTNMKRRGAMALAVILSFVSLSSLGAAPVDEQSGAVLRVATQPIVQIDPAFISSDAEIVVAAAVYDYLIDIDSANRLQPRLAESWSVSADGLTYTFELASGVQWHDGSAFTSADVVWTFDRLRDPDVGSPTVSLYENIESIDATAASQVVFNLVEPNPFFLFDLSDNHALVIKNGTTSADEFNGTGPFELVSYTAEDRIELVANDSYFRAGEPALDGIEVIFYPEESAAIDALRSNQVDIVWRFSNVILESLQGASGIETISVPTNGFDVFRIRADRGYGADERIIRAIKMAVDRDEIYDAVQRGLGGRGNDSPIGPLYADYHLTGNFTRDVTAARALLAEAGYADGFEIDLHTPDTGGRPDFAVLLKEQLADIGIEVNVVVEPESVYYGSDGWLEVDFGITGWGSRPVPQFYFDVMLVCGARWNEAHFCDPELDRLVSVAGTTLDESSRQDAYADLQQLLFERGPLIIPYYFPMNAAVRDSVSGFDLSAFAGRTNFRTVTVD